MKTLTTLTIRTIPESENYEIARATKAGWKLEGRTSNFGAVILLFSRNN